MWSSCWENLQIWISTLFAKSLWNLVKWANFCIRTRIKKFLYEKSSTRKVTYELNRGNFVQHLQNPQKPNRTKDTGLLRSRGGTPLNIFKILKNLTEKSYGAFKIYSGKNRKNFKLTSGAPFARCATSNRKKLVSIFF